MRDPRWWREKTPAVVAVVTAGFKRLYGKQVERAEVGRAANAAGLSGPTHRRDLIIGHLAPGEIVVPPQAPSPAVMAALRQELGDQLPRFIVGSGFEPRNPLSGLPGFSPENEDDTRETADQVLDFLKSAFVRKAPSARATTPPLERSWSRLRRRTPRSAGLARMAP